MADTALTDDEWLVRNGYELTPDQSFNFSERVSIKLDGNTEWKAVDKARQEAHEEFENKIS